MRQQNKPLRFVPQTINVNGVPTRVVDVYDPISGEYLGRNESGEAGYAPYVQPAIPGVSGPTIIPRTVEEGGGVRDVGKAPPPPQGIVRDLALDKASLEAINMMDTAWQTLQTKTAGQTFVGKVGREMVGASRYGGAFKQTRDYAAYRATMANSLNAYIKAQTGAQFSVKEMDRYTSLYPEPWDDIELKNTKMEALRQRAVADMREKLRNYPAAQEVGGETPAPGDTVDDILREWDERRQGANPTP